MEKVTKFFRGKIRSVNPEQHTAEVVLSGEVLDRYKERVMVSAFKKTLKDFMLHPVMVSSHAYRGLMSQIGEYIKIWVDEETKELVALGKWYAGEGNPEADWGWKLAEKGIAAFSIGFIPKKWVDNDTDEMREEAGGSRRDYTDVELLEASQVLIPALKTALQRSFDSEDEDLIQLAKDITELLGDDIKDEEKAADPKPVELEIPIEDRGWEETENEIRHRLKDPNLFKTFRYMALKKDKPRVNAVYAKYKDKNEWTIQALRFPKGDGWTMADAKKWVADHPELKKDFEQPDPIEMLFDLMDQMAVMLGVVIDAKTYAMKALEKIDEFPPSHELNTLGDEAVKAASAALDLNAYAAQLREHMEMLERIHTLTKNNPPETVKGEEEGKEAEEVGDDPGQILSEEKLNEFEEALRRSMGQGQEVDIETVRSLLDQMTEEIAQAFSKQPTGNATEGK